jgi:hypothetical protein
MFLRKRKMFDGGKSQKGRVERGGSRKEVINKGKNIYRNEGK